MTFQQIKDERIEQAKHKIYAELMLITYGIIVISYCIKSLYFGMDLRQCATEFIILILAPLYQAFRSRQMGVVFGNIKTVWWKQLLPVLGVVVLLYALVLARNYVNGQSASLSVNIFSGVLSLVSFIAIFIAIRSIVVYAERRRAERLAHQYDDED